jgi:hypothetical protein
LNQSRAGSLRSNQENYNASHDDIYEQEDEDLQVSRHRHDKSTTFISQANGEGDEDDWPPVPGDDDEASGRRPETISHPLGARRVTLTLKATNVPQKRHVGRHVII